jgi:hypothetical protein
MTTLIATRLRRQAAILRDEKRVTDVITDALQELANLAGHQLLANDLNPAILDTRHPLWQRLLHEKILPAIGDVFTEAATSETPQAAQAVADAPALTSAALPDEAPLPFMSSNGISLVNQLATDYLTHQVQNRLTGVAGDVFQQIIGALNEGRERDLGDGRIGESIPQLAARLQAFIGDTDHWRTRATTIARTQVIGAHNAGYQSAASYNAAVLGYTDDQIAKKWLATTDSRTRESHARADGQTVIGLATPFDVGGSRMQYPGDSSGPPEEVINCRCTVLHLYPDDPAYPGGPVQATSAPQTPLQAVQAQSPVQAPASSQTVLPDVPVAPVRVPSKGITLSKKFPAPPREPLPKPTVKPPPPEAPKIIEPPAEPVTPAPTPAAVTEAPVSAQPQAPVKISMSRLRELTGHGPKETPKPEPAAPVRAAAPAPAGRISGTTDIPQDILDVLQPAGRGWDFTSYHKVADVMKQTETGKNLLKTMESFQGGGSAVPRLRNDVERYLGGETGLADGRVQTIKNLLGAIGRSTYPRDDKSLFRGMSIPGKIDDVLARYQVGDDMDLSISSFSSDKSLAQSFTKESHAGQAVKGKNRTPVLVEWVGDSKHALPIEKISRNRVFANEKEWIGAGKYRIEGVRKVKRNGTESILLTIRQTEVW